MKQILLSLLVLVLMTGSTVQAQQDTAYLDINANVVDDKASATEYAIIHKRGKKQFEICFYTLDGKLTRSCEYSQFKRKASQRTLNGITRYKFQQSEQDSLMVHYTRNRRNGEVIFYYPSGTVMARGQYKDDMLDGPLTQYYENGAVKRKETYKKDVSQGGCYLSTDSTSLDFIPFYQKVAFKAGEEALMKVINQNIILTNELLNNLMENGKEQVSADICLRINALGETKSLTIRRTDSPLFSDECFRQVLTALQGKVFTPCLIDGRPVESLLCIKDVKCVLISR